MLTNTTIGHYGRFGNQIFQFAALIGISEKNNYNVQIPINNIGVCTLRECFDIDDKYFSDNITIHHNKNEAYFHFDETMFSINDFTNISGYFQSEKYFQHCKEKILEILKFKPHIKNISESLLPKSDKELVSIHIRRGDYVNNPHHCLNDKPYIDKAISELNGDYHFVVFSDDIKYVRSVFKKDNFTIFESNSYCIDFCAMSLCHHNIISNSSFSWWSSYLNKNQNKKIIAPKNWFGRAFSHLITKDIYTDQMIII